MLKAKSLNSLTLSIEHFNRPWDHGRTDAVLIFMDHSFEMLLKAAILQRGGAIRRPKQKNTMGFDECVRAALSTKDVQFLTSEQALTLQAINGLRDAAQHHLLDISEGHLYLQAQSGITLHRDLLKSVFSEDLRDVLPERVLPIATVAPLDPINLFSEEIEEVAHLLSPGKRRRAEAQARLRSLAIVDGAMQGERLQPSESELAKLGAKISAGTTELEDLFPGIAAVSFEAEGTGTSVSLRIAKNEGVPVKLVQEGTTDSSVVAVKRVNELDFYVLRYGTLAQKLGVSTGTLTALIHVLDLKQNLDYSKKIINTWCYSPKAVDHVKAEMKKHPNRRWTTEYRKAIQPHIDAKRAQKEAEFAERAAERKEEHRRRLGQ